MQLPDKTEQVLFCALSEEQRSEYRAFLHSEDMASTLGGKRAPFAAITELRKICNHPDLVDRSTGDARARSHCRFALPFIHFRPDSLRD